MSRAKNSGKKEFQKCNLSRQSGLYPFLRFLSPISYVLHPFVQVFPETFDVVILPGVAGPEVENAVVGVAAVSEVAESGVVFAGIVFVALA